MKNETRSPLSSSPTPYSGYSSRVSARQPTETLKLTLVCHELPYPPNHGARVDMWRRIKAMHQLGTKLQLISWVDSAPTQAEIDEMNRYVEEAIFLSFNNSLSALPHRLLNLLSYPLEVASRMVRGKTLVELTDRVKAFQPDAVILDGLHGGEIALHLKERLSVPLIMRSHNIEHLYYGRLLDSAKGSRKVRRLLSLRNLEQYEKTVFRKSAAFYDISSDDLHFWREQGFTNGYHLPPLADLTTFSENFSANGISNDTPNHIGASIASRTKPEYDIVFLGNLHSDNNVEGVNWFLTQVLPIVRRQLPETTVLIAGAKPTKQVKQICESIKGVELRINPISAASVYQAGEVLINPVQAGSGVSIKSIEMLTSGKPIVSTPQGVAGLPETAKHLFKIAADAESFGAAMIALLSTTDHQRSVNLPLLESLFGQQSIEHFLLDIQALASRCSRSNS